MLGRDVLTGQTTGMRRDEICHSVVKERKMVVKEKWWWVVWSGWCPKRGMRGAENCQSYVLLTIGGDDKRFGIMPGGKT